MSWTVSYSYGTICESMTFEDEDAAIRFYEIIVDRIQEYGDDSDAEYESRVEISEDEDDPN